MKNEEAIKILKNVLNIYRGLPYARDEMEAIDLAVRALKEYSQNGCDGCKYESKDMYEVPCLICKYAHGNQYKRDEERGDTNE